MSALILSSGDYLVGCLASGINSIQPSYVAYYIDNATDIAGNSKNFFSGVAEINIVSPPTIGQRIISRIDVYNNDLAPIIPYLKIKNGTNEYSILNRYINSNSSYELLSFIESANSSLLPSPNQKSALIGTSGDPSELNKYVTDLDYRVIAGGTALQPTGNGSQLTGLTNTQVGLGNVNNTADADKPVSTAQSTALNTLQNLVRFDIALTSTGTGSGVNLVQIQTPIAQIYVRETITYPGYFCDATGATNLGQTYSTATASHYVKVPTGTAILSFYTPSNLSSYGKFSASAVSMSHATNGPTESIIDVAKLPRTLTSIGTYGALSGVSADLPIGLTEFGISAGTATLAVTISTLPKGIIYYSDVTGSTGDGIAVTGLLNDINPLCYYFKQLATARQSHIHYNSGKLWPASFDFLRLSNTNDDPLTSTEIDNILIDMAAHITTAIGSKIIWLSGAAGARTAASNAAFTYLSGLGFTVTTN